MDSATSNRVGLTHLNGTPVLRVHSNDPEFGRVYGAVYLAPQKTWVFPAFYPFHAYVQHDLSVLDTPTELDAEAQAWTVEQDTYASRINNCDLDPRFKWITQPYNHQKQGVAFGAYNLRSGILYDPGMGKTKVAIDILRYRRLFNPVKALVVVPVVILYKWMEEVLFHSGGELRPVVIDGTPKKKKKLVDSEGDVYIATYGSVSQPQLRDYIAEKLDYDTLIVDESHNLQSHNSVKTQSVAYLSRKAPRRILMSGTAALGDPRHLWGQLFTLAPFINPEKGFFQFCGKFVHYGDDQRRIVVGFRNLDVLNKRLHTVSVRKTKEEALDLPERTFVTIPYPLTKAQKDTYNELVTSSLTELEEKLNIIEEATPAARLTKLLQIQSAFLVKSNKDPHACDTCPNMRDCVENQIRPYTPACSVYPVAPAPTVDVFPENPKRDALLGLLDMQLVEPTNKVVAWCKFLKELDDIEEALNKAGIYYVRVDGSLSGKEMRDRVKEFQTNPDCRVYIAQISTGVGIELTAANTMIFYSLSWDLAHWIQALDRSLRIGQTRNVTVYVLLHYGAVDDAVYGALSLKEDISAALLNPCYDGPNKFIKKITRPVEI